MCRGITFEKIASHTKYEEPNVQSHHRLPDWILIKQIIDSSILFAARENRIAKECTLGKPVISFCLRRVDKKLVASFEWEGVWVKIPESMHFLGMWTP